MRNISAIENLEIDITDFDSTNFVNRSNEVSLQKSFAIYQLIIAGFEKIFPDMPMEQKQKIGIKVTFSVYNKLSNKIRIQNDGTYNIEITEDELSSIFNFPV